MPTCWIIAGPNGAGKTTFALQYLPHIAQGIRFINADLIAAGLSPLAPEGQTVAASRLLLQEIDACIQRLERFSFETTLAGRGYLKLVQRLRSQGWRVELIYLALPSMTMSKLRVAERVAHGGHPIPTADIERRFARSLVNLLHSFSAEVDACQCFMNSGGSPDLIFEQRAGQRVVLHDAFFNLLVKKSHA